jgi:dipeptidase D
MSTAIEGLKPELMWKYFAEISAIPRGSKNEKKISAYLVQTAKKLGLEVVQDKHLNVIVRKPASAGHEQVPSICLQGHMDMVCEKNKETVHDFEKDPIELVRKGNVIMANGTTLGADNGVAVAANLAIMEDKSLVHGPLEFLFTSDEETGLTGANGLKAGSLKSMTMMNLDSEEEGALYVGCSGGRNTHGTWKLQAERIPSKSSAMMLTVKGLKGGHSGLEIDKGRGNSLKIMNRALLALMDLGARVGSMEGGNKSNAIPREAESLVYIPSKDLKKAVKAVAKLNDIMRAELASVEPDLHVELTSCQAPKKGKVLSKNLARQICLTVAALPHGVIKMSADIPGLVETSTNVAIIKTDKKQVELITSQRSSVATEIDEVVQMVAAGLTLGGAKAVTTDGYPGWKPNLDSVILKTAKASYQGLYGVEPHVKAIHAGLECGIIGEKFPGMDMVSFGPTLEGVHSPDEKIYIDSVEKFWKFLLEILKTAR